MANNIEINNALLFTLNVMAIRIGAAMAVDRALGVELVVALTIGGRSAIAPDPFALHAQRRTVTVEAVTGAYIVDH